MKLNGYLHCLHIPRNTMGSLITLINCMLSRHRYHARLQMLYQIPKMIASGIAKKFFRFIRKWILYEFFNIAYSMNSLLTLTLEKIDWGEYISCIHWCEYISFIFWCEYISFINWIHEKILKIIFLRIVKIFIGII